MKYLLYIIFGIFLYGAQCEQNTPKVIVSEDCTVQIDSVNKVWEDSVAVIKANDFRLLQTAEQKILSLKDSIKFYKDSIAIHKGIETDLIDTIGIFKDSIALYEDVYNKKDFNLNGVVEEWEDSLANIFGLK